jgi:hypothetical protein
MAKPKSIQWLEIGVVADDDNDYVIHAMPAPSTSN